MAPRSLPLLALVSLATCARPANDQAPAPADTAHAAAAWEGRYRLVTANGESLPADLGRSRGCSLHLVYGALTLSVERFYFTHTIHERCEGETLRQESYIAQGAYRMGSDSLHLAAEGGMAFDTAEGISAEGQIRLTRLGTEAGVEDVDWLFVRRR